MRTIFRLCLAAAIVAAVGLVAVPVASANAGAKGHASITSFEKKQNKNIKKAKKKAKKAHDRINAIKDWNFDQDERIGTQRDDFIALKSIVDTGVPLITDALLKLQSALEDNVAPALLALKSGLETLGTFVTSDEYGIMQVTTSDTANGAETAVPGCFYETADIPDNVQGAYMSGTCLMSGIAAAKFIHFRVGIRSNESDGTGAADPVGAAGIVAYEQQATACTATPCGILAGGGATGPNAGLGGAPVVSIPDASDMVNETETSFPFAPVSTDNLVDLAQDATFTGTPADPVMAGAGNPVRFTIRFVDLTADPDDPSA